jgi:ABC-type Na+ efflux pump permease subunit
MGSQTKRKAVSEETANPLIHKLLPLVAITVMMLIMPPCTTGARVLGKSAAGEQQKKS